MAKMLSLKSSRDFARVYKKGRSKADSVLVLYVLENRINLNRIGISVSRKVGKSVIRNRVKRLIREAYRRHKDSVKTGYDLVFISRVKAGKADFHTIESSILYLLKKHNILIEKDANEGNNNTSN